MSMRKALSILITLLLCCGIFAYTLLQHFSFPEALHKQAGETATSTETTYKVIDVVDGDTIDVDMNGVRERVRYIGMNTPETVAPGEPVECFGKEASERNEELVSGKNVLLIRDVSDRDKYGRLLRYVYADGEFINLELVEEGYAEADTVPPDILHAPEIKKAAADARANKLGLWASCKN